jgi:NTE family protein
MERMSDRGRALVIGGGGVTGVAWATGLIYGLAEHGVRLAEADVFVGTSAGSVVAAQLTSDMPLDELFARQLVTASDEVAARIGAGVVVHFVVASAWPGDRSRGRAWLGRAALRAPTMSEAERRSVIERRLPAGGWPQQRLLITAVDAHTGAATIFDADSGVGLFDAVAASCAVPLVWPPVTINGRRYVDGGVRSVANVDLAAGYGRVVVVAPIASSVRRSDRPAAQAAALGVPHVVVSPDRAARKAIGRNVLDPAFRAASAHAGQAQAATVVDRVRAVWSG